MKLEPQNKRKVSFSIGKMLDHYIIPVRRVTSVVYNRHIDITSRALCRYIYVLLSDNEAKASKK